MEGALAELVSTSISIFACVGCGSACERSWREREGAFAASVSLFVSVFYCGVCVCERDILCKLCGVAVCVSAALSKISLTQSNEGCFVWHNTRMLSNEDCVVSMYIGMYLCI